MFLVLILICFSLFLFREGKPLCSDSEPNQVNLTTESLLERSHWTSSFKENVPQEDTSRCDCVHKTMKKMSIQVNVQPFPSLHAKVKGKTDIKVDGHKS